MSSPRCRSRYYCQRPGGGSPCGSSTFHQLRDYLATACPEEEPKPASDKFVINVTPKRPTWDDITSPICSLPCIPLISASFLLLASFARQYYNDYLSLACFAYRLSLPARQARPIPSSASPRTSCSRGSAPSTLTSASTRSASKTCVLSLLFFVVSRKRTKTRGSLLLYVAFLPIEPKADLPAAEYGALWLAAPEGGRQGRPPLVLHPLEGSSRLVQVG